MVIMDVKEIRDRNLSMVLADFQMCENCRIVDRDHDRVRYGHKCNTCGVPGEGGLMLFRGFCAHPH